jgi:putative glutamine amidotransferase
MTSTVTIGITDCMKYDHYERWFRDAPENVEIIRLSYHTGNISDVDHCDGVVLSGGEDIHPQRYHRPDLLAALNPDHINTTRDAFEWAVTERGLQLGKPILGICRGLQLMNVYLGGSLIHDIPSVKNIHGHGKVQEQDSSHAILLEQGSLLEQATGVKEGVVNSAHHQSVAIPAPLLTVTAIADQYMIEAMEWKEKEDKPWLLLVQWHPERMTDQDNPFAAAIRTAFIHQLIQSK